MSIRIYLNNRNIESSEIRVYRSTSRIEDNALPEPIAILPGNARYYDEPDYLFYDVDYYYRIAVTDTTGTTTLSPNQVKRLSIDVGPGPTELMHGDETFGVFGLIRTYEHNDILECFKYLPSTYDHSAFQMIKYIRKGVVHYLPTATLNVRADNFSAANLIASTTDKPAFHANNAARYSGNQFISGDRKFSWHLPSILTEEDRGLTTAEQVAALNTAGRYSFATSPRTFSEAIDVYRLFFNAPNGVRLDKSLVPCVFMAITMGNYNMCCADNLVTSAHGATITVDGTGNNTTFNTSGWGQTSSSTFQMLPIITYEGKA